MKQIFKKIFSYLIFDKLFQYNFFTGMITKGIISPLKVKKIKLDNLTLKFNVSSTETYKFLNKFWISDREIYTRDLILKHLNDGDTFLNIGAHIGTFVIYANKLKQLKQTICIEASSANINQLLININLNSLSNVEVFNSAAGNIDKFVEFSYTNLNPGYYNGRISKLHYLKRIKPNIGKEFTIMKKMDNLFYENKLPIPNFLLMDIDGHEKLALNGMRSLLKNKKLKFAIIETTTYTDKFVIDFMEKIGFVLSKSKNDIDNVNNRFFKKL